MPIPNDTKEAYMRGSVDLANNTIKVLLLDDSSGYTFAPDTDEFLSDVLSTGTEMSGTGYSRKTLANQSVSEDTTDDEGVFDADDVTWTGLDAGTIQTIVIYQQIGGDDTTPGDDRVLHVFDDDSAGSLGSLPLPTNGSDIAIQFDTEGLLNLQ